MYDLNIPGWMHESELQIIEKWASNVKENGVIVELGSYKGRSAYCWAKSCHHSVKVYCIDMFKEHSTKKGRMTIEPENVWSEFLKYTSECKNIIPIKGNSPKKINYPGDRIDVFFIDASHYNPSDIMNIQFFRKFFNRNALICGHDYSPQFPHVIANAKYLAESYNKQVTLYANTGLWSIQT